MSLDDDCFAQFRAPDADGGVVRSYAHTWTEGAAIGWAIETLHRDPAARVVLVIADHHRTGSRCYERFDLYREGGDIRCHVHRCRFAMLDYGLAHASAELTYLIGRYAKGYSAMVFRQPPKE